MPVLLEIAAFNLKSAIDAAQAGADRIELCENLPEGGVTPSYGSLKIALEKIAVPVFPIIRPRGGDFFYDSNEFAALLTDVKLCRELGFGGIVTGVLKRNGQIDRDRMSAIAEAAGDMQLTCHRAFDRALDPFEALENLITLGFHRVLTSGQQNEATEGVGLIRELNKTAGGRILIIPGSGVTSANIKFLAEETQVKEIHSSARKMAPSQMDFIHPVTGSLSTVSIDAEDIKKMKQELTSLR